MNKKIVLREIDKYKNIKIDPEIVKFMDLCAKAIKKQDKLELKILSKYISLKEAKKILKEKNDSIRNLILYGTTEDILEKSNKTDKENLDEVVKILDEINKTFRKGNVVEPTTQICATWLPMLKQATERYDCNGQKLK